MADIVVSDCSYDNAGMFRMVSCDIVHFDSLSMSYDGIICCLMKRATLATNRMLLGHSIDRYMYAEDDFTVILSNKLRWFGYVSRMLPERFPRKRLQWIPANRKQLQR